MFALPWDEDDRTVAEWAEEEHQTFIQFVAPLVAKTLDWSEIADEPLETMSTTDSVQWTAGIASPTKPASAAPTASIVKRRGLPYAPGFIPHQPIRNRFATIAKYSKLPRKIGTSAFSFHPAPHLPVIVTHALPSSVPSVITDAFHIPLSHSCCSLLPHNTVLLQFPFFMGAIFLESAVISYCTVVSHIFSPTHATPSLCLFNTPILPTKYDPTVNLHSLRLHFALFIVGLVRPCLRYLFVLIESCCFPILCVFFF